MLKSSEASQSNLMNINPLDAEGEAEGEEDRRLLFIITCRRFVEFGVRTSRAKTTCVPQSNFFIEMRNGRLRPCA